MSERNAKAANPMDPLPDQPAKKKAKTNNNNKQSNLSSFFHPSSSKKKVAPVAAASSNNVIDLMEDDDNQRNKASSKEASPKEASVVDNGKTTKNGKKKEQPSPSKANAAKAADKTSSNDKIPAPIIPKHFPSPNNVVWQSLHEDMVLVRKATNDTKPRTKVAAFDLDGTLFVWTTSNWPSQLAHYELWSSTVPSKLQALYDEGYKLVLVSNQGTIQKAHTGKKATLVKSVVNFLAHKIERPIHAVMSTKSLNKEPEKSFHKPRPKLWQVAVQAVNKNTEFDVEQSFFVGDSADPNDEQGGVDRKFAQAVSSNLKFYTPREFFGPSDSERRQKQTSLGMQAVAPPPKTALDTRLALLGGYVEGPILLLLCGVQGAGKSYFCQQLLKNSNGHWVHLSQDTIRNGKPGKREQVEAEAKDALERGRSVVVDRTHLDKEQRRYFVDVAKAAGVPAHAVLINPPKEVIAKRVRERTEHPAGVEGESGAKIALGAVKKLVVPTYDEDLQLISFASTPAASARLASLYKRVISKNGKSSVDVGSCLDHVALSDSVTMPAIALGTMNIGKKATKDVLLSASQAGFAAFDTAPTYKNEDRVGDALVEIKGKGNDAFVIAKIPKAAANAAQARESFSATLQKLQRPNVDLLLLHWPCDVMAAGTLSSVWKEMETLLKEGKCKALGVCNFNIEALAALLTNCTVPPRLNQVERHPLLAQAELVDFCTRNNILLQAHTPLGQGKEQLLANPTIQEIAAKRSMTPAQVVLRWNLQQGVLVVPKCSSESHAQELMATKPLHPKDMKALDALDAGTRFVAPPFMFGNKPYCWGVPRK